MNESYVELAADRHGVPYAGDEHSVRTTTWKMDRPGTGLLSNESQTG